MVYHSHDMPPHFLPTEATLDEILFVLGEPLCEEEVWAILLAGSIALLKYFDKAAHAQYIHYLLPAINPDTLLLSIHGNINFLTKKPDNAKEPRPVPLLNFDDKNFVSPENLCNEIRSSRPKNGKTSIEKMFIYSLGMCMVTAARHCTDIPLESLVSMDLQACLAIMVDDSLLTRISADSLKKVCSQHIDLRRSTLTIKKLSKEILGSVEALTGSTTNLILPNPLDSYLNTKKSEKELLLSNRLKLPKPVDSLLDKDDAFYDNKFDHTKLILPVNPKEALLQEEKASKHFSPMHMQHIQSLAPLCMSKTNDSVDMSRAITSTPSASREKNSHKLTMEYNGSMTTTLVVTRDDTRDTLEDVEEASVEYLPDEKECMIMNDDSIVFETNEESIIEQMDCGLQSSGLPFVSLSQQSTSPVAHIPMSAVKRLDSTQSAVSTPDVSPSHISALPPTPSPITTPSEVKEHYSCVSPITLPPVTPSPITPSQITRSQMSPSPISTDKELNLTQSPVSSAPISPSHLIPLSVATVKEVDRISSANMLVILEKTNIEEVASKDETVDDGEELANKKEGVVNGEGVPAEERGSIEGRASSSVSPVSYGMKEGHKSMPSVAASPSPAPRSERSSIRSGRRHSSGSYGTALSGRSNTLSQVSLTQGAYSLDKGLDMEPEYPLSRFKSAGALSLCRVSSSSLPYAGSVDGTRRELDLPQLGPEFVRVPSDPDTAFVDITPVRLGPLPKKIRLISVILLNAQEIQTQVQVTAKGKELFEQIATHIGLKESLYFGFALLEDGEHMFIDLDEKLTKYAPLGWKDEGNKKKTGEFVLHFKVKFFIENPRTLKHKLTSHFYYLHLRKAIATGYSYCFDDSLLLRLAGYALQAEYGDFVTEFSGFEYFRLEHYLPSYLLTRINHTDLYCNLTTIHQTLSGKSQYDAEMGFLDEVRNVEEYGILFHKVSRSKDNAADSVLLGICINGIIIKEHKRNQRKLVHQQSWDSIKKFYFEKKQFKLKSKTPADAKLIFFTSHYRRSKYLFKMCQSFHRFQIFNQPVSKQSLNLKKEQTQLIQSTFSDPIHKTLYNTLKGSEYSNYTFKSGEMKISSEIKFVQDQNEEEYSERSIDVLNNANGPITDKEHETEPLEPEPEPEPPEQPPEQPPPPVETPHSQLQRGVETYPKDTVLVNGVEIEHKPVRTSPRSIYSDEDGSIYTDSELSARNMMENRYNGDNVVVENGDVMMSRQNIDNESGAQYDRSYTSDIPRTNLDRMSNGTTSSFSMHNSDFAEPSNLKRMSGMNNLDMYTSPSESVVSHVESEGVGSFEMYGSGSDHVEEISHDLRASPNRGSPSSSSINDNSEVFEVPIEKREGSYGFSITGGIDSDRPLGGIFVKSLLPNGAASLTGKIKVGDRLVAVGGYTLDNVTHSKAVDVLKHSSHKTILCINRTIFPTRRGKSRLLAKVQHLKEVTSQEIIFDADVEKEEGGLGLCLAGGKGSDLVFKDQLMVRKIFPGLPIARCGKFQVGDILIAINDQIVEGMTHQEALSTIRNSQKRISIIAKRPNPNDIPDELFMCSRPVSPEDIMRDIRR